jgi:hypothetical protein
MNNLKGEMKVIDRWRDIFPTEVVLSFNQAGNASH